LGWLLGVALHLQQSTLPDARLDWFALVLLGLIGLFWLLRPQVRNASCAFLLVGLWSACLAWVLADLRSHARMNDGLSPELEGRSVVVQGVVAAMPQRLELGQRFAFETEGAWIGGIPVRLPKLLWLSWYDSAPMAASPMESTAAQTHERSVMAGDRWHLTVRLKRPHANVNPHGFDYELWLWEQGFRATGYVRHGASDPPVRHLARTWRHPVERVRQIVRDRIWTQLAPGAGQGAAARAAGVVVALVTGDQRAIDRVDWAVFRDTGVAHLMSISGLHITLLGWLACRGTTWIWRWASRWGGRLGRACIWLPAPWVGSVGGLLVALAYSAFCGWGVPAQRTVGMLAVVTVLQWGARRWPWPWVWAWMATIVSALDPWSLMQPGFWLSFVAVAVLFSTDPQGQGVDSTRQSKPLVRRIGASVVSLLREQWVMTLALAPLTLLLFGQISLVGLIANLLAVPWVTLLVTPLALLGIILAPLWTLSAWAVQGLEVILHALAAWPWATWSVARAPLWVGLGSLLGALLMCVDLPWLWRCLGLPLLLPVLLWHPPRPPPGQFDLMAADVGQGNAVIVRTEKHTLLYDAGPRFSVSSDAGERVLVPLLQALGEQVDRLMLSHRDVDHTGGAAAILAAYPGADLVSSLEPGHRILALAAHHRCEAGQAWRWDGVDFSVLHPQPGDYSRALKPNGLSCVLRIESSQGAVALLVGDIERAQEQALVSAAAPLRADFLLVPHHGSKTSSTEAFLDAVEPGQAMVQAGYRNRFGHPAKAVVDRYLDRGIPVQTSSRCGAATWTSQLPTALSCERETSQRYWHREIGLE
jgi:competence protein ComEC